MMGENGGWSARRVPGRTRQPVDGVWRALLDPAPVRWRNAVVASLVCVLLATASLAVPSAPTYDPMAWLSWGRQILAGELHTTGGPSWKPLPVFFTTMFAPAGDAALELWLVVARAGWLGAVVVAFVLARQLAGVLAGCMAAVVLTIASWMLASGLRGYLEGVAVLLVLVAVERHGRGRVAQGFWFAVAAALVRPEGAAFVGVYALWLVWKRARRLPWVAAGVVLLAVLWTLPEKWGSGNLWRAAERAQDVRPESAALAAHPAFEIVALAFKMVTPLGALASLIAIWIAASGVVVAPARRLVWQLATVSFAWTGIVAAMTERGFAGNWRYLVVPAALTLVLAAAGVSWSTSLIVPRFGRAARRLRFATLGLTATIIAAYAVVSVPQTLRTYAFEVEVNEQTELVLMRLGGGERLRRCGRIYVNPFLVQRLAWELRAPSMTIAGVHQVPPNATGAILRTRVTADQPLLPRADPPAAGREVAQLRTERWKVDLRCDPAGIRLTHIDRAVRRPQIRRS
jgi:hypothetical protein